MSWSPQQEVALAAVSKWAKKPGGPQVFRLFGFAGTGKTTLARTIADDIEGKVLFGAFTGKAAQVLRSKGCRGAQTIHSLIYSADEGSETPSFTLNSASRVAGASLVIIDECSMVNKELGEDLMSFGTKILVLGDPFQLPPVRGDGFFTAQTPDIMLTEIHRQARDNPIIRMSIAVREGGALELGTFDGSIVKKRADLATEEVTAADQVLVGKNMTRSSYNRRFRELRGITTPTPVPGDRLVCLRNDRKAGLLNGSLWDVNRQRKTKSADTVALNIMPADSESQEILKVKAHIACFTGGLSELPWQTRKRFNEFDYGYALTVHKAQGSQWDSVMLFDESGCFQEHRSRWLYTGITRAAKQLTVVM